MHNGAIVGTRQEDTRPSADWERCGTLVSARRCIITVMQCLTVGYWPITDGFDLPTARAVKDPTSAPFTSAAVGSYVWAHITVINNSCTLFFCLVHLSLSATFFAIKTA